MRKILIVVLIVLAAWSAQAADYRIQKDPDPVDQWTFPRIGIGMTFNWVWKAVGMRPVWRPVATYALFQLWEVVIDGYQTDIGISWLAPDPGGADHKGDPIVPAVGCVIGMAWEHLGRQLKNDRLNFGSTKTGIQLAISL